MNCSKGRGSLEEREMGLTLLGLRVRTLVHHFVPLFFFLFRRNVVFTKWKLLKNAVGIQTIRERFYTFCTRVFATR